MEEKIALIDKIVDNHPSYGVNKGWSWYTGGMADTGAWHFRKMLDVSMEELKTFYDQIQAERNKPKRVLTIEEQELQKQIYNLPDGGFITGLGKRDLESYAKERERKLFFDSGLTD